MPSVALRWLWAGMGVILISLGLQACKPDLESHVAAFGRGGGTYHIDSHTILQSLRQNELGLFTARDNGDENEGSDLPPVQWTQADYWRIAEGVYQQVFEESVNDWKLTSMLFGLDCADVLYSPQQAVFEWYSVLDAREYRRLDRWINISPRQNKVDWGDSELSPVRVDRAPINLSQIRVPVEEALRIAEKNGGQNIRTRFSNQCKIFASLASGQWNGGWWITYDGLKGGPILFQITVDSHTGDFHIEPIR